MFRRPNIHFPFILVLLLAFLMAGLAVASEKKDEPLPNFWKLAKYVDSNRHTRPDDLAEAENHVPPFENPTVLETDMGTVYLDEEALAFQFYNENGFLWSSTVDHGNGGLSPNWVRKVRSAVHIESFNTASANYATTEEFVLSDGTTKKTKLIKNGFESRITFGKSRISLLLRVTFTEEGILVEIPEEEIEEPGSFVLGTIKVYPFFGGVLEDAVPGYVFIPDGVGALVRYRKADPSIIANYKKEIYGSDLGYTAESNLNREISDTNMIHAPVFGFVHGANQNAIFGNILSGAEYGNLNIYYAGRTTLYTTVFPEFVYRRTYRQPIDRAGNWISLLQNFRNKADIKILYTPLPGEDANYVGMAKLYRKQLGLENRKTVDEVPLKLETIGLEKSPGLFFHKTTVMTRFDEFKKIASDLKSAGIKNLVGVYFGYTDAGVTWSPPNYKGLAGKLGGKKAFREMLEEFSEMYLAANFVWASSKASGFNTYRDLAKKINDQNYVYQNWSDTKYLLKHGKSAGLFRKTEARYAEYDAGFALQTLGTLLYSDFRNGVHLDDAARIYRELLEGADKKTALYLANAYLFQELDAYFDFPMYSSQYLQFSDTVPFLAIVLNGVPLFGTSGNFYPYARDELLRLIDYGVYPSFIVTEKSSKYLQDTELEHIFASRYEDLKPAILVYHDFVNQALKHTSGALMSGRSVSEPGLVRVDYDNRVTIILNYTETQKIHSGHEILPKNYLILKDGEVLHAGYPEVSDG